jgi:hypothetical protein
MNTFGLCQNSLPTRNLAESESIDFGYSFYYGENLNGRGLCRPIQKYSNRMEVSWTTLGVSHLNTFEYHGRGLPFPFKCIQIDGNHPKGLPFEYIWIQRQRSPFSIQMYSNWRQPHGGSPIWIHLNMTAEVSVFPFKCIQIDGNHPKGLQFEYIWIPRQRSPFSIQMYSNWRQPPNGSTIWIHLNTTARVSFGYSKVFKWETLQVGLGHLHPLWILLNTYGTDLVR